jgi:hypothetical protein
LPREIPQVSLEIMAQCFLPTKPLRREGQSLDRVDIFSADFADFADLKSIFIMVPANVLSSALSFTAYIDCWFLAQQFIE